MKKILLLVGFLPLLLSACNDTNSSSPTKPTPSEAVPSTSPVASTPAPPNPSASVLSSQEIYDLEFLRADWSKEQMQNTGLEKQVNDLAGETSYFDENIKYIYIDYFEEKTPGVIDVFGEYPGPKGFHVGDTFEDVLALFPQDEDWENNESGVFYGMYDPKSHGKFDMGSYGYVATYNGEKEITLVTENVYPFLRIFFKGDVVSHFTFYLIPR